MIKKFRNRKIGKENQKELEVMSKREDYVAAAMEHYARFRERQRTRDDAR